MDDVKRVRVVLGEQELEVHSIPEGAPEPSGLVEVDLEAEVAKIMAAAENDPELAQAIADIESLRAASREQLQAELEKMPKRRG